MHFQTFRKFSLTILSIFLLVSFLFVFIVHFASSLHFSSSYFLPFSSTSFLISVSCLLYSLSFLLPSLLFSPLSFPEVTIFFFCLHNCFSYVHLPFFFSSFLSILYISMYIPIFSAFVTLTAVCGGEDPEGILPSFFLFPSSLFSFSPSFPPFSVACLYFLLFSFSCFLAFLKVTMHSIFFRSYLYTCFSFCLLF